MKRYDPYYISSQGNLVEATMKEDVEGDYVKYADLREMVAEQARRADVYREWGRARERQRDEAYKERDRLSKAILAHKSEKDRQNKGDRTTGYYSDDDALYAALTPQEPTCENCGG